jgi:ElaB/YqjD/DUF883 family membrane-anchored ribosome-binding protein
VFDYPTAPRSTEAVETLICSVEELLRRIPAAADSELSRVRARATNALAAAKAAVADRVARTAEKKTDPVAIAYLDACIRERPSIALAVAAMIGVAIGLWADRSAHSHQRRSGHLA